MSRLKPAWMDWLTMSWEKLEASKQDRYLLPLEAKDAIHVKSHNRNLILFSSNDYLGLSSHPRVCQAASEAAARFGMGPRGSALICGYTEKHQALESALAQLKGAESALLFPTGYAANTATIQALADSDLAIFSDALNHASIIDGCRLAKLNGADVHVYGHGDLKALDMALNKSTRKRKLVVSDALFSMDGDLAPLNALAALREKHGFLLMLDEAHSTLIYGQNGGGLAEELNLVDQVDLHMGTLSKSFGSQGGFVATSNQMKRWLLSKGRGFIYSTALPLPAVVAAHTALNVFHEHPSLRERLRLNIEQFGSHFGVAHPSPIFALMVGDESAALKVSESLLEAGIHATGIRPPTVPANSSRIRITLSAAHSEEDINTLISALKNLPPSLKERVSIKSEKQA